MGRVLAVEAIKLSKEFQKYRKKPGVKGSVRSLLSRERHSVHAIKSLSLNIDEGEVVGLIGENGAGKSTFLKMLSGILKPTSGSAKVLGYSPWERKRAYLKQISFVMGNRGQLWWDLPVVDSFELQKEIYQIGADQYKENYDQLVDMLNISEYLDSPVRKLSLGQRMRCELALALLHSPKLIFLDEPTLGLDLIVQKKLRDFLLDYNKKTRATIIMSSHYMDDVKEMCRRVILLSSGEKLYDGSISELARKYAEYKTVTISLGKSSNKSGLEKYGEVENLSRNLIAVKVPRKDVPQVAARILKEFDVEDLDIREPELDDIVRTIYEER
ncbi:MAG: ATP-binding cassette domain-containing protein [Candidatus Dojkabacteria bacterium]|nr:MAG: ATP-binding cassette domain-containing protein [Candidatus Dojkabacteria bacterium]